MLSAREIRDDIHERPMTVVAATVGEDEHSVGLKEILDIKHGRIKKSREQAFELLKKYNEDEFHIQHGETLEALMRYYAATYDPENVDFWGQVGLLHDLDWEKWQDEKTHTVKAASKIGRASCRERV